MINSIDSYSITKEDFDWLREFVSVNQFKKVIEFGPGRSTSAIVSANPEKVTTYEFEPKWAEHYANQFSSDSRVNVFPFSVVNDAISVDPKKNVKKADFAFIDSPVGTRFYSRLSSCVWCSTRTNVMVLHDANRKGERQTLEKFIAGGWTVHLMQGDRGIAVLTKLSKKGKVTIPEHAAGQWMQITSAL